MPPSPMELMLREHVNPAMKQMGFRKTGRYYRLGRKGQNQSAIWLQTSIGSWMTGASIFYVSCALMPRCMYDFQLFQDPDFEVPDDPTDINRFEEVRLQSPEDIRLRTWSALGATNNPPPSDEWSFTDAESAGRCGEALVAAIRPIQPLLDRLRDPRELIAFYELPRAEQAPFRVGRPLHRYYKASLLADLLPAGELVAQIDQLRQPGEPQKMSEFADWILARARAAS